MPKSIALAEDDADDQLLFAEALKQISKDCYLIAVSDGSKLLELLEQRKDSLPDVIVLDVNMPGMNGIACLKLIRETREFDHLPVIIMSTSTSPKTVDDAYAHGADSYAIKPGKFDDLKRVVEKILVTDWSSLKSSRDRNHFVMRVNTTSH